MIKISIFIHKSPFIHDFIQKHGIYTLFVLSEGVAVVEISHPYSLCQGDPSTALRMTGAPQLPFVIPSLPRYPIVMSLYQGDFSTLLEMTGAYPCHIERNAV